MAEKTKAELEKEIRDLLAHITSLRAPFIKAGMRDDDPPEKLVTALNDMVAANGDMLNFINTVREPLIKASLVEADAKPSKVALALVHIVGAHALHANELRERDAIIAELRARPLVMRDADANKPSVLSASADDISEDEIRAKTGAGLDRKTAIQVIRAQRAEDAANAAAAKAEPQAAT